MTSTSFKTAAVVAVLSLLSCGRLGGLVGSGKPASDSRTIGAFKKVDVATNIDVTFIKGERGVEVITDENLLKVVDTTVNTDGVLVIKLKQPVADSLGVKVNLTNDVLEGVNVSGSSSFTGPAPAAAKDFQIDASGASKVDLTGLTATKVVVNASGASEVTLTQGASTELTVAISGASKFVSHGFTADDVQVEVSGGSSVCATANKSVTGNASGGSTVTISGAPATMEVNSSGGSRLIKEG